MQYQKYLPFLVISLMMTGCSGCFKKDDAHPPGNDTAAAAPTPDTVQQATKTGVHELLGSWTDGFTENATFELQKDSIFYVDQMEAYPYQLSGDSIHIRFQDYDYHAKISWTGDTLVMTDAESGPTQFTRFKN